MPGGEFGAAALDARRVCEATIAEGKEGPALEYARRILGNLDFVDRMLAAENADMAARYVFQADKEYSFAMTKFRWEEHSIRGRDFDRKGRSGDRRGTERKKDFLRRVLSGSEGDLGDYIVGPEDLPVYWFTADKQGGNGAASIACTSQDCLEAWPLVRVEEEPTVGAELDSSLVGTTEYDGQTVVTYNGWPLYRFVRDEIGQPPQGNHVGSFGGEWYLLAAQGERVEGGGARHEHGEHD